MEIIIPVNVRLKPILGSGPSRYPAWEPGLHYDTPSGSLFYDAADGHNYELAYANVRSRPSEDFSLRGWVDLGPSPGNVIGYVTNQPVSPYPEWINDVSVITSFSIGSRCFFFDTGREYQSVFDFTQSYDTDLFDSPCEFFWCKTVDNRRPLQQCADILDSPYGLSGYCLTPNQYKYVLSSPWVDIGPINVLRALDPRSSLRTRANTSPLTMTVQADGNCDRIAFFGLQDVDTISVAGDVNIPSVSLQTGASGLQRSSVVLHHSLVNNPEYSLTFTNTGTSPYPQAAQPAVGAIVAGRAVDCGPTEINIQSALVTPRLNENDRGQVSRAQQWYSKRITGILRPPARTADLAMTVLATRVDEPLVLDFSRGQLAESGPLVYGFLEQANHTITGLPDADAIEVVMRGYSQ